MQSPGGSVGNGPPAVVVVVVGTDVEVDEVVPTVVDVDVDDVGVVDDGGVDDVVVRLGRVVGGLWHPEYPPPEYPPE